MPPGAKEWSEEDDEALETKNSFVEVTEVSLNQSPSSKNLIDAETETPKRDPDTEITVDLVELMATELLNSPTPTPGPT